MSAAALFAYEARRAARSLASAGGLLSLVFGAAFLSFLTLNGIGPSHAASTREIGLIFGAAWAALAAVYAIDRNRNSLVEDVWFALEPRWRPQLAALYAAWLPVALVQAAATMLVIIAVRPGSGLADLIGLGQGFALALPLGLCMAALARLVPGFSLLGGAAFLAIIFSAFTLTQALPSEWPSATGIVYVGGLVGLFVMLTRATGRSR